ncbi:MAG TPA: oligosaccharide flippase family protein [Clostridiales bacterium]|nr:oligosaccharide flippase family protein [Clostridiales bacterium]
MMKLKYRLRTLILVLPNLVSTIISIVMILYIYDSDKYLAKIISTSLIHFGFSIVIMVVIYKKSTMFFNKDYWKYGISISTPIILHGLSLTILSQSDRIMLTAFVGADQTAVYSLVYNFGMIASVVAVSLDGIWVPWFVDNMKKDNIERINEKVIIYIKLMTFVILGIILISPEVLVLLAPKEYLIGDRIVPPIVISSYVIFLYTIYVDVEHYYKKTSKIAINTIIAASCNIILNYIFIPLYGMYAASITTLISYLLSLFLHYRFSKKINESLFPAIIILKPLLIIVIGIIVYYLFLPFMLIRWIMLILLMIYAYFNFKNEINTFILRIIKH